MSTLLRRLAPVLICLLALTACPGKKESAPASGSSPASSAATTPKALTGYSSPSDAVKGFFQAVNDKNYGVAWNSLTAKSQSEIIAMVAKDEKMEPKEVKEMFEQNQMPIQLGFWNSFRESSKTPQFTPQAAYKALSQNGDQASVELSSTNMKLEVKAFKEGDSWKTGYIETFME